MEALDDPGVAPIRAGRFPAILDERIAAFLGGERKRLFGLAERYGSPLNIVWPHTVERNLAAMRRVLGESGVDHAIYYGVKVNKSQALVRAAVTGGAGVDASSLAEFEDALRAGATRICATGPAKTAAFHRALVEAGALVVVDSLEELADLEDTASAGRRAHVLLRLRPRSETRSRFGMSHDEVELALRRLASDRSAIVFDGLHVHLSSYRVESRIAAMSELAGFVDLASALGTPVRTLDIGGGMPIRYVAPDLYAAASREQRPEDYRTAEVPGAFYPYGSEQTVADWLEAFLDAPFGGATIANYLRSQGIRLAIEPGRSLVDQAAISVFRIARVKRLCGETAVVFVEGSSFSACETWFGSEFLVDPILVPCAAHDASGPLRTYIAGHSCLDDDIVTNRWLDFADAPRAGDLLIYANTAGYQMDLLENEFHRHPMPTRLVAAFLRGDLAFVEDK